MSYGDDLQERAIKRERFASVPAAVTELERWASACDVDACAAVIDDSAGGEVLVLFGTRAALLETPYGEHYSEAFTSPPQRAGEFDVLVISGEQVGRTLLSVASASDAVYRHEPSSSAVGRPLSFSATKSRSGESDENPPKPTRR